jgi:hypothetical protein
MTAKALRSLDQKALLVLEDGTSFAGRAFGAAARSHGLDSRLPGLGTLSERVVQA